MINKVKVEKILESIRPYLKDDNGDIKLINISDDGIVEVELLGTCADCPLSMMTLRAGVERALIKEIPEIRRVEAIN